MPSGSVHFSMRRTELPTPAILPTKPPAAAFTLADRITSPATFPAYAFPAPIAPPPKAPITVLFILLSLVPNKLSLPGSFEPAILPPIPPIIAAAAIFNPAFFFCSWFICFMTSSIVGAASAGKIKFSTALTTIVASGKDSMLHFIESPAANVARAKTKSEPSNPA